MWFEESVIYQIYPFGFCGAPDVNDGIPVSRIRKVAEWIPHMKELGITALYLCPVWESDRHGYDTRDFQRLDCRLGSNQDLKELACALHENGIRLILDGVFHHVGRGFWAFQDLLKNREGSRYKNWFCGVDFYGNNEYQDGLCYQGWEGHNELVSLNLGEPEVRQHIFESVEFWIREFDIDGIRLDVAYSLPDFFLRELRSFVNSKKQEFFLVGEMIHGDYRRVMNPEMADSVTNYQAYKGMWSSFNDANFFEINYTLNQHFNQMYPGAHLLSFLDNHDVDRVASILKDPAHLPLIYGLLFAVPGIPCIYYGSEWGAEGRRTKDSDAALRPCFEKPEHNELTELIAKLARIRRQRKELCYGGYRTLFLTNRQIVFERAYQDQRLICAINLEASSFRADLPGAPSSALDLISGNTVKLSSGLELPPCSFLYLVEEA